MCSRMVCKFGNHAAWTWQVLFRGWLTCENCSATTYHPTVEGSQTINLGSLVLNSPCGGNLPNLNLKGDTQYQDADRNSAKFSIPSLMITWQVTTLSLTGLMGNN